MLFFREKATGDIFKFFAKKDLKESQIDPLLDFLSPKRIEFISEVEANKIDKKLSEMILVVDKKGQSFGMLYMSKKSHLYLQLKKKFEYLERVR